MSLREEQCNKVCRILDDVLANRPTERDSLILAVRKAFAEPRHHNTDGLHKHYEHYHGTEKLLAEPQERKGKWMYDDSQLGIRCSKCGTSFNDYVSTQDYVYLEGIPSFCPKCGARMEVTE